MINQLNRNIYEEKTHREHSVKEINQERKIFANLQRMTEMAKADKDKMETDFKEALIKTKETPVVPVNETNPKKSAAASSRTGRSQNASIAVASASKVNLRGLTA